MNIAILNDRETRVLVSNSTIDFVAQFGKYNRNNTVFKIDVGAQHQQKLWHNTNCKHATKIKFIFNLIFEKKKIHNLHISVVWTLNMVQKMVLNHPLTRLTFEIIFALLSLFIPSRIYRFWHVNAVESDVLKKILRIRVRVYVSL